MEDETPPSIQTGTGTNDNFFSSLLKRVTDVSGILILHTVFKCDWAENVSRSDEKVDPEDQRLWVSVFFVQFFSSFGMPRMEVPYAAVAEEVRVCVCNMLELDRLFSRILAVALSSFPSYVILSQSVSDIERLKGRSVRDRMVWVCRAGYPSDHPIMSVCLSTF